MTEEMKSAVPSLTGYSCPKCGKTSVEEKTLVHRSNPDFFEEPDPHYKWKEWHRCDCGIMYTLNNGS